jgi:hypothetical protein
MSEPQIRRLASGSTFFDMNGSWNRRRPPLAAPASILRDPAFRRVRDDTLIMLHLSVHRFIYPSVHSFIYPSVRASEFDCVISRLKIVGARSARSFSLSRQCRDGSLGFHKAYFIGPLKKARIIRSRALMARSLRSNNLGCFHAAFPMRAEETLHTITSPPLGLRVAPT